MSIVIQNPKTLGIDYKTDFLGQYLRYRVSKSVTISGMLLDLVGQAGVTDILDDLESVLTSYIGDLQDVAVNGISLGTGLLNNISFSSGNDVRTKTYTASFVFFEDGDLTDKLPDGVSIENFKFIESISEDFTCERQVSGNKLCNHKISIKMIDNSVDGIPAAKVLASSLLANETLSALAILWDSATTMYNVFSTESYNKITNECLFSKKFEWDVTFSNLYSKKVSHTFTVGNSGASVVEETAEYKTKREAFSTAFNAMVADVGGAYAACSEVYDAYKEDGDPASLSETFFERKMAKSENDGVCSYTVSFSNDIFYRADSFWSYDQELSVSAEGVITVTESGEIIGLDIIGDAKKQSNANNFWKSTVKGGIESRLNDFYAARSDLSSIIGTTSNSCATNLYLETLNVTKNNRSGKVAYNSSYSNDPSRNTGSDDFKKIVKTCSTQGGEVIKLSTNVLVPNYKEVKQISANDKESGVESSITLFGKDDLSFEAFRSKIDELDDTFCKGDVVITAAYDFDQFSNKMVATVQSVILSCS